MASIDGKLVRRVRISVQARPDDLADGLKTPLAALVDELPPDVGSALVRLVHEKPATPDSRTARVRGFQLSTAIMRSSLEAGHHEVIVTATHPDGLKY